RDTLYPYRQDSDLWYLAGFPELEAVLVLVPGRKHGETLLFCRERDPEREGWDGPRAGPEGAVEAYGMDDAYPIDDLDEILPGLLEGRTRVYYHFGRDTEFDLKLIGWLNRVRAQVRLGAQPPHEFLELGHLLDEMRLFKSRDELKLMRHAARISMQAHEAAMRAARPGVREYELQAELERVFRAAGAEPAYNSIVGAGANACVLHYRANRGQARDGDLVLIDAGAEYHGYAADITRTFPANGRFTKPQRELHDLVDAARAAALEQARPGVPARRGRRRPRRGAGTGAPGRALRGWPRSRGAGADRGDAAPGPAQGQPRTQPRQRRLQALLPAQDRTLARAGRARRGRLPD